MRTIVQTISKWIHTVFIHDFYNICALHHHRTDRSNARAHTHTVTAFSHAFRCVQCLHNSKIVFRCLSVCLCVSRWRKQSLCVSAAGIVYCACDCVCYSIAWRAHSTISPSNQAHFWESCARVPALSTRRTPHIPICAIVHAKRNDIRHIWILAHRRRAQLTAVAGCQPNEWMKTHLMCCATHTDVRCRRVGANTPVWMRSDNGDTMRQKTTTPWTNTQNFAHNYRDKNAGRENETASKDCNRNWDVVKWSLVDAQHTETRFLCEWPRYLTTLQTMCRISLVQILPKKSRQCALLFVCGWKLQCNWVIKS